MRDMKALVVRENHGVSNLTMAMLSASAAAFWCLNIYTMFNWGEGMMVQKLAVQSLAWLHTICLWREGNR